MLRRVGMALAALAMPAGAQATVAVYDVVGSFSASSPDPVWSYGTGQGGSGFTSFAAGYTGCFGNASLSCRTVGGSAAVAGVGRFDGAGATTLVDTVTVPDDALWMHPGDGGGTSDVVVRFTAPTTGRYQLDGLFERLSNAAANGGGNGVNVAIYNGANPIYASSALASPNPLPAYSGTGASFSSLPRFNLIAGDTLSFVVNNNGAYNYDSTGLKATVTARSGPAVYDAFAAFASGNPSASVWRYGTGEGAASFTAFPSSYDSCFGMPSFACETIGGTSDVAGIGRNTSLVAATVVGTVNLPTDMLWMHPSDGGGASDAVVQFVAPKAGDYTLSGLFARLSNSAGAGHGDGVTVSIFNGDEQIFTSSDLTGPNPLSPYSSISFSAPGRIHLASGAVLSFVVNNNGTHSYDSTGLRLSVAAVPEPASWAMMLAGFGALGITLRRGRAGKTSPAA